MENMVGIQHSSSREKDFVEVLGLREEIEKIQSTIADFETGKKLNIAIVAEPLKGKTTLSDKIERINLNRAAKITFSKIVQNKNEISLPDDTKKIVILDNCHFLYMRKPGGFDIFYEFLDMISFQNRIFITTWNTNSWKFLNEAFGLGKYFPVQIFIPAFEKENLRLFILNRYEKDEIKFAKDEESEEEPFFYIMKYPLELALLGKKIFILVPKINISYLKNRLLKKQKIEAAEDQVFEKLYLESKGNPGIALRIWELGLDYPVMKPKNIGQFSYEVDLEYEEAFTLSLILSYQGLTKSEITEIMGPMSSVDKILYQLLSQELILKDENDSYRVRPEALSSVTTYMEKLRLVW
ncbi:hypothetical protein [Methanosarcina vacuolata]|uniref:hypothetical protein n=1 Tax=Methanosarcina vacuolata TaxID=2215 RepID=UPI001E50CC2D|nr:hypothetical protein [Methanosarcina vacuolata]